MDFSVSDESQTHQHPHSDAQNYRTTNPYDQQNLVSNTGFPTINNGNNNFGQLSADLTNEVASNLRSSQQPAYRAQAHSKSDSARDQQARISEVASSADAREGRQGNNRYGAAGTNKCRACRQRKSKVSPFGNLINIIVSI
jgi:hypothetical protein